MAKIVVPKTPASAYNPRRRPSDLIRRQIQHLEWALLPASQRKPKRLPGGKVKTEAQAAEDIALLTARVQEAYTATRARGFRPDEGPVKPVRLPQVPKAPKTTKARKAAKARKRPKARKARKATRPRRRGAKRSAR